jgi:Sulfotransferase family
VPDAPDRSHLFLFGAQRSGTTWLQSLLGSAPEIVTPQESNLFDHYVGAWETRWRLALPSHRGPGLRQTSLPTILTEAQFDAIVGHVVEQVYDAVCALKPSARVVLDKNPAYVFWTPTIRRYLPDAKFIHLVRDGRDVAASLLRASNGFGRRWAPRTVEWAASLWRGAVEAGLAAAGPGYLEVRYEELRSERAPEVLQRTFAFAGVDVGLDTCRETLERFSLEAAGGRPPSSICWGGEVMRLLGAPPEEPDDFYGAGIPGAWRDRFGGYERWLFDRRAGELLVGLGYEADRSWARTSAALEPGFELRRAAARSRRAAAAAIHKARQVRTAPQAREAKRT